MPVEAEFVVKLDMGCVMLKPYGYEVGLPFQAMDVLTKLLPKKSVIDPDAARITETMIAAGLPHDLEKLKQKYGPGYLEKVRNLYPNLSEQASYWLALGEQGTSSMSLFQEATGVQILPASKNKITAPQDPADLKRCLLLIDAIPEARLAVDNLAVKHAKWASLAPIWDDLVAQFENEVPNWRTAGGKAPITYMMMKEALEQSPPSHRL